MVTYVKNDVKIWPTRGKKEHKQYWNYKVVVKIVSKSDFLTNLYTFFCKVLDKQIPDASFSLLFQMEDLCL